LVKSLYFVGLKAMEKLFRFQADIDPKTGSIIMSGYWQRVADLDTDSPVIGPIEKGFQRSYSSLDSADQAAGEFPEFSKLALMFQEQPFTAFTLLLEAIKASEPDVNPLEGFV
jgi:hypothetical protein